jgi:hypothetical protein
VVTGGWLVHRAGWPERLLCVPAAALLLYLHPITMAVGAGLLAVAVALNLFRSADRSRDGPDGDDAESHE